MELSMEMPYVVASFPKGHEFNSSVDGHAPLSFKSKHAIFAITIPNETVSDLKIVEGVNDQGLNFSLLAYMSASGPSDNSKKTKAMLAAIDLGAWILSQFESAEEVKSELAKRDVILTALAPLHGAKTPFHYTVHDKSGKSIVIEFSNGKQNVFDNPVGVMTNGPEFNWHLTNLNNYTFLNNLDQSDNKFGDLTVSQPDSGIATTGLPASNTSVGRFVRGAYYLHFAEKAEPKQTLRSLAHIMNNFDRPRGITIDPRGSDDLNIEGAGDDDGRDYITEYTSWTVLGDLNNQEFYIRTHSSINFIKFDLKRIFALSTPKTAPLEKMSTLDINDVTDAFLS
ncbi:linear amide C-N hydrolase [Brucella sp. 21LCYQ03]|nr:linear amide C-N hydrolase [Brucella sp. 21LCYQ03]